MAIDHKARADGEADDVAAAMQRVLEAERTGAARVAGSRRLAAEAIQAARAEAEVIRRRADLRIARLQSAWRAKTDAMIAATAEQPGPDTSDGTAERAARIDGAVARLAVEMTS